MRYLRNSYFIGTTNIRAILFTHWHQPFIEIDAITNITKVLDDIADDVWSRFLNTHTSIVSNHFRAKSSTRTDYLTFVKFDPAKRLNREYTLELLKYVSTYLYCEYGFRGDYDHENWIQNSFINQVLERKMGIPITLSIVHKLIARRLDIECDIIDFPRRVILRYSFENEATNEDVNRKKDTFFIDPFDDGKFLTYSELQMASFVDHILEETDFKVASTKNIIQRLARNLIANLFSHPEEKEIFRCFRFSVECSLITNPSDFEMRFLLLKLYLYLGIELDKVLENLKELSNKGLHESLCKSLMTETNDKLIADNNRELHIVKRSDPINVDVLYSIGMIMTHKKYKYICVIISWDPFCRASEEWKRQMGVNKLQENGEYQPFYHVLVKDGTTRYAAQENLTFAPAPCFITHPDIGMYFEEYKGSHYTANLRKKMEYPEDEDFTGRITNAKYSPLDMQTRVYALKP
ncbi:F-box only protein 21-like isoform X1 [Gordionus sp. m RMFG-2023]|uniref:F-box only protein 21-like isoform X1 n=2 Tax=Gordionus sp. m RMFG-2023 TaxID=3053472 RepID=UPI0031FBB51D